MGDFYLEFRESGEDAPLTALAQDALRWFANSRVDRFDSDGLTLLVSRTDNPEIWGPAIYSQKEGRVVTIIAGRAALTGAQWEVAKSSPAAGGLACRAITDLYLSEGVTGLEQLSGAFSVVVLDERVGACYLVTDRGGLGLAYEAATRHQSRVICSHPDVLAAAVGREDDLDLDSLAEFVATGRVSFPFTYYQSVRGLQWGATYGFKRELSGWVSEAKRRYFALRPQFSEGDTEASLADELAEAFTNSVRLRTLPVLGKTSLAMSGGMDSRALLSVIPDKGGIDAFILLDRDNPEADSAAAVAAACGIELRRVYRDFDYYGNSAASGARIGGGMGCLASNHFLGSRDSLQQVGTENILTGCYCDYLFKALALNTTEHRWTREEQLAPYKAEFYRPHYKGMTVREEAVANRIEALRPAEGTGNQATDLFEREQRRVFPLALEGDSAQRVIPQRAMPSFLPMADRQVLEVYQRIPSRMKLNGVIFKKMLQRICSPAVLNVPNSNTGATVGAGKAGRVYFRYRAALLNRVNSRLGRGMATRGSWPNWSYYTQNSATFQDQWNTERPEVEAILEQVIPTAILRRDVQHFQGRELELLLRIWTLKLWLAHRVRSNMVSSLT